MATPPFEPPGMFDPLHPECIKPETMSVGLTGQILGVFLVTGTLIAPIPQVVRLVRARSSAGMSVLTPALVLSYGTCAVCSTITVKWNVFQSCSEGAGLCTWRLLDVYQQISSNLMLGTILVTITSLRPNNTRRKRALAFFTLFALTGLGITCLLINSSAPCSVGALRFAFWCTASASLIVTCAFVPQLIETWRSRGRGSISYLYYATQAFGCCLVNVNQIYVDHDPWQVWLPTTVAALMQFGILATGFYFLKLLPWVTGERAKATRTLSHALLADGDGGAAPTGGSGASLPLCSTLFPDGPDAASPTGSVRSE
jgi:uncharacterized protein with PQ loop repeat